MGTTSYLLGQYMSDRGNHVSTCGHRVPAWAPNPYVSTRSIRGRQIPTWEPGPIYVNSTSDRGQQVPTCGVPGSYDDDSPFPTCIGPNSLRGRQHKVNISRGHPEGIE